MVRTTREVVHQIGRSTLDHRRTPATRIRSVPGRTREGAVARIKTPAWGAGVIRTMGQRIALIPRMRQQLISRSPVREGPIDVEHVSSTMMARIAGAKLASSSFAR